MKTPVNKTNNKPKTLPKKGLHPAICNQLIDLGTQPSRDYDPKRRIMIGFEILDSELEMDNEDGTTRIQHHIRSIKKPFNLYGGQAWGKKGNETHLFSLFAEWFGEAPTEQECADLDYEKLIGKPAMLNLTAGEGKNGPYVSIGNVLNGDNVDVSGKLEDTLYFSLEDIIEGNTPEDALRLADERLEDMASWIADMIKESLEYVELVDAQGAGATDHPETPDGDSSDLPF